MFNQITLSVAAFAAFLSLLGGAPGLSSITLLKAQTSFDNKIVASYNRSTWSICASSANYNGAVDSYCSSQSKLDSHKVYLSIKSAQLWADPSTTIHEAKHGIPHISAAGNALILY